MAFRPWIGEWYLTSPTRLLVVGESHYGSEGEDHADLTRDVVEKWRTRRINQRYLTKLAILLSGKAASEVDRTEALNEIAFYNYLQVLLAETNKERAGEDAWSDAQAPFLEVVHELDPTHILVTSHGAYRRMPEELVARDELLGGRVRHICEYPTPSGRALTMAVPHLSRIATSRWSAPVAAFRGLPPIGLSRIRV